MPDNLTKSQRSYCMSCVKGKDTSIEMQVRSLLHQKGYRFRKHVASLPGKPDIVFKKAKVAVFLDGDFWHGYRFSTWKHKVSEFWVEKISKNVERDKRNRRKLRSQGWRVIRIWQHEIETKFDRCIDIIETALEENNAIIKQH